MTSLFQNHSTFNLLTPFIDNTIFLNHILNVILSFEFRINSYKWKNEVNWLTFCTVSALLDYSVASFLYHLMYITKLSTCALDNL